MALINCPECNKEVSDTALTCPHCGYQLKKPASVTPPAKKTDRKGCLIVLLTLCAIGIVSVIVGVIERIDWSSEKKTTPSANISENPYIVQWAGYYTIEVKGYSGSAQEKYALRNNGVATWVWVEPDGMGGDKELSRKIGNWDATANKITTTFGSNTGDIKTEYVFNNGVFVEVGNTDRFLKRYKQ
jgi:hypothetical protein